MIISILTILLVIALHLFPRRIREKVLYRIKRAYARIRKELKHIKQYNYDKGIRNGKLPGLHTSQAAV